LAGGLLLSSSASSPSAGRAFFWTGSLSAFVLRFTVITEPALLLSSEAAVIIADPDPKPPTLLEVTAMVGVAARVAGWAPNPIVVVDVDMPEEAWPKPIVVEDEDDDDEDVLASSCLRNATNNSEIVS
jgi:hypothetical protein